MIFKIQWPIITNEVEPYVLIFNETKDILFTKPASNYKVLFDSVDNPLKLYVEGRYSTEGVLMILDICDDQNPGW